ncbi:MAG TPA: hypothetical protein DCY94_04885 [Firmicutes bacterium]|nr:hypothetical protein [Bacillota bacterium]
MNYLYHGSHTKGLKTLEPHKSTHGTYVYATPFRELSVIFSGKDGDDLVYSLFRTSKNEPWKLVERLPHAFETMYEGSSSIYTVEDTTFKDIKTGFAELVSESAVPVVSECELKIVYDELEHLEMEGLIEIYRYPKRPEYIPEDDHDLLEKEIRYAGNPPTRKDFERLLLLHPTLLDKINDYCISKSPEFQKFTKLDILAIFDDFLVRAKNNPSKEYFLKSAKEMIILTFPELAPSLDEKYPD